MEHCHCGLPLPKTASYCSHCGARRGSRLTNRRLIALLGAGAVCLGLFSGFLQHGLEHATRAEPVRRHQNTSPFTPSQKVIVSVPAGCTPKPGDFPNLATAITHRDQAALGALAREGKVLLLDAGTRAEVLVTGLAGDRTHIYIESGEHIGRSCDLLTTQISPNYSTR